MRDSKHVSQSPFFKDTLYSSQTELDAMKPVRKGPPAANNTTRLHTQKTRAQSQAEITQSTKKSQGRTKEREDVEEEEDDDDKEEEEAEEEEDEDQLKSNTTQPGRKVLSIFANLLDYSDFPFNHLCVKKRLRDGGVRLTFFRVLHIATV